MPWKNPDNWSIDLWAPLMAVLMSIIRVIYDDRETPFARVFLESLICGLLTVSAVAAIGAMGLPPRWGVFAGGAIGFLGTEVIHNMARDYVLSRRPGLPGTFRSRYSRKHHKRPGNSDEDQH